MSATTDDELNAAIATEVMGWGYLVPDAHPDPRDGARWFDVDTGERTARSTWSPATDIADAFEVVERMHAKHYAISITWDRLDEHPRCSMILDVAMANVVTSKAPLPRAICEAALRAVRAK